MDIKMILAKARLSSAYCTSGALFDDLENAQEPLSPQDVLELFDVWNNWYLRRYLAVELNEKKDCSGLEDILRKRTALNEYRYLYSDFMGHFQKVIMFARKDIILFIQEFKASFPGDTAKLVLIREFLMYMFIYHIFDSQTISCLTENIEGQLCEFNKKLKN